MDIIKTIKSFFVKDKVEIIDNIEFRGKEIKLLDKYKEKLDERLAVTKLYIREKNIESEEVKVDLLYKTRIIAILYCFNTELDMDKLKCVDEVIRSMDDELFKRCIDELKECNSIEVTEDNKVILKHITKFLHYNSMNNLEEDRVEKEEIENKDIVLEVNDELDLNENIEVNEVKVEEVKNVDDNYEKEDESVESIEVKEENIDKDDKEQEKKETKNISKHKEENEEIKDKILIALKNKNDFITIKEIREDEYNLGLSKCTSQKISALIRQLVEEEKVERVSEKKVIRFKIK